MVDFNDVKIKRSRRNTMSLHLLPGGIIEVRAPLLMPTFLIKGFVKKHFLWIEKRIGGVAQNVAKTKTFRDGEFFEFLGVKYPLVIGNYSRIEILNGKLHFPNALLFRAKIEMENWYIRQAKELIKSQVEHYSKEMGTTYVSISFSNTKSKWGSCTHDNRLQFNWRLILAPLLVVRYVVIHELAHTMEKNHSHKFWSRVAVFNPSYKQQIKWLKNHGDGLVI